MMQHEFIVLDMFLLSYGGSASFPRFWAAVGTLHCTSDILLLKACRTVQFFWYSLHMDGDDSSSAALSLLPWPKPAVWPAVPRDVSLVLAKEKVVFDHSPDISKSDALYFNPFPCPLPSDNF